jgi:hypothetical protein
MKSRDAGFDRNVPCLGWGLFRWVNRFVVLRVPLPGAVHQLLRRIVNFCCWCFYHQSWLSGR